jgi:hypothetical protein
VDDFEFRIVRLRLAGLLKPPHARGGWEVQGRLHLHEETDPEHHRQSRVARVSGFDRYGQQLELVLRDAALVYAAELWTLTGFERPEPPLGRVAYLQSWCLQPVTAKVLADDERQRNVENEARARADVLHTFVGPPRPLPPRPRRRHR